MQQSHAGFSSPSAQSNSTGDSENSEKPTSLKLRLEEARLAQQTKLKNLNEQISIETLGGKLIPFFLINGAAWRGDMGKFLMLRLNLLPFEDWNLMYLAEDEAMAFVLDCPAFVHADGNRCQEIANSRCQELKDYLDAVHKNSEQTGDVQTFAKTKSHTRNQIQDLAKFLSNEVNLGWQQRKSAMGIKAA